jgi:hypothetical protein
MPFASAGQMLGHFTRVRVSEAMARRRTEEAGAAYVAVQTAAVEALEQGREPAEDGPVGPAVQQVSVDGALVPLIAGDWAEVKTLAIGTVGEPVWDAEERRVHTTDLSYFSRLADHATFGRLATVETERRGVTTAGTVVAIVDGAEWEQTFLDLHCPGAVRILDWGHAAEYVVKAGQALFGTGTAALSAWLDVHLHELKHGDPETVLDELRQQHARLSAPEDGAGSTAEVVAASLAYLEKRREQIRYAEFRAQGYPIGSGIVESANKLVVETRLKGAGMHWARAHVNPLVALRTIVCSDRWEEGWAQIASRLRHAARDERHRRHIARQQARRAVLTAAEPPPPARAEPKPTCPAPKPVESTPKALPQPWRPPADHPWRRPLNSQAALTRARSPARAET